MIDERGIFVTEVNSLTVRFDPVRAYRIFVYELENTFEETVNQLQSDEPLLAFNAAGKLIALASKAFCVPLYNPELDVGLTDQDVLTILSRYVAYLRKKKESRESMPTSPAPTEAAFLG